MTDNTSSGVLRLSGKDEYGTAFLQFFNQGAPQILLANSADDKVIIPHDLLPESQSDAGLMIRLVEAVRHLVSTIRNLESENARLKKQCEHLACDVVSALQDYGAPMSDCRSCDYDRFCKRKPGQIEPDWDMCEAAVLKACEPVEDGK